MKHYSGLFITIVLISVIIGCSRERGPEQQGGESPAQTQTETMQGIAGLQWSVPLSWRQMPDRPMRVATYTTAAVPGGSDSGELAVFYFGPGEGGSVEANVQRWFGQFEQPDGRATVEVAERESLRINSIPVTIVRTSGTYTAAAGPMAPRRDIRENYKLIGAIAEGPHGAVFFKLTGPAPTVDREEEAFMQLVRSISLP